MIDFYQEIASLINNKLIKNNFIILSGTLIAGFGNYLYNFAMIRMLTPVEYSEIAALLSLFSIISIPASAIQISISRYSAEMAAAGQFDKLSYFVGQTIKYFFFAGIIGFILFVLAIPLISSFLNLVSAYPLLILSFFIIILFVTPVALGVLQGMQKFFTFSASGTISTLSKLALAVLLVWLGFKEIGAIAAIVIGSVISFLYAYYSLKLAKTEKTFLFDKSQIIKYSQTVLFAAFSITILSNIDIILVKHFWSSIEVANYSVLSLTGKIIFFITSAASFVMFPLIVNKHSQNKEHLDILTHSFLLVLTVGLIITAVYFFFPGFIINLLFGSAYLQIAPYLGYFGLIMIFFSLINLLITYNLSINNSRFIPVVILSTAAEILLILLFHQNINQVMIDIGIAMILIFIILIAPHLKYILNKSIFNKN